MIFKVIHNLPFFGFLPLLFLLFITFIYKYFHYLYISILAAYYKKTNLQIKIHVSKQITLLRNLLWTSLQITENNGKIFKLRYLLLNYCNIYTIYRYQSEIFFLTLPLQFLNMYLHFYFILILYSWTSYQIPYFSYF